MGELEAQYKLAIPPYYFSLIDCEEPNDPIRLQSVTSPLEANSEFEMEDPLEEDKDSPVPGITHRYPDRCLLKITHTCAVYCRFCFRREMVGPAGVKSLNAEALHDIGVAGGPRQQVLRLARLALAAGADGLVCSPQEVAMLRDALGAGPLSLDALIGRLRDCSDRSCTPNHWPSVVTFCSSAADSISSRTATPRRQATGLPPKVVP